VCTGSEEGCSENGEEWMITTEVARKDDCGSDFEKSLHGLYGKHNRVAIFYWGFLSV
jgi:hypothetical protein